MESIQTQQETIKKQVEIALIKGGFMANNVQYKVLAPESLSGDRWRAYRKAEIEVAHGMSLLQLFQQTNEAITALQNMTKFGDAHTALEILLNNQKAIKNFVDTPQDPLYRFCAIFCVIESENIKQFDEMSVINKIEDWEQEGLPNGFFTILAANIMSGFIELYNLTLRLMEQIKRIAPEAAKMKIVGEGTDARLILED